MRPLPKWFHGLLRALPREFRRRHAAEMSACLAEQVEGRSAGSRGLFWARAAIDVLCVGATLRGRALAGALVAEGLRQDVRHAVRSLRRAPGLTAFVTLVIGLGVGASATVYSVADTLLLRPLPFADPDQLVFVSNGEWGRGQSLSSITTQVARLQDLADESRYLTDVAGFYLFDREGDHTLSGAGAPERVTRLRVTDNFFALLGVRPRLGRFFTPQEVEDGGPAVALLPHASWVRHFGADPGVVGRTMTIDEEPITIIGVLPASFDYGTIFSPGTRIDYITPFPLNERTNNQGNTLALIGRLAPGADLGAVNREAAAIAERNPRGARNEFDPVVRPLREHVSGDFRFATLVLVGSVGLVMLIVCANVSNLLLARGAARERELAARAALGAGRARILRHLLAESVMLASLGGALGLALAVLGTRSLARLDANIPLLADVRVDWAVLAFTILIATLTGVLAGVVPAARGSGAGLRPALESGGRGGSESKRLSRIRGGLVVSGVALACVLLVGAGLLVRSFVRLLDTDLGFDPDNVVSIRIDPTVDVSSRFDTGDAELAYFDEMLRRARSQPAVEAAGLVDVMPMAFNRLWCFDREGDTEWEDDCAYVRVASEGYLDAMGIALVTGRDFTTADRADGSRVILINEALAESAWPGRSPLGRTLENWQGPWEVVGVVRGMRHLAVDQAPGPEVFFPFRQQSGWGALHLIARGSRSLDELTAAVRRSVAAVDPALPLGGFRPIAEIVDRSVSARRFTVVLLGTFAGFALLLASLGIYAVVGYSVARRRREIGIRIALGASERGVRRRIVLGTLALTALGVVLGLVAAGALSRLLAGLLYEVRPDDPVTFTVIPLVLTAVAVLAGWVPARRAARVDPVETLGAEA